jgi:hypothetical protein
MNHAAGRMSEGTGLGRGPVVVGGVSTCIRIQPPDLWVPK